MGPLELDLARRRGELSLAEDLSLASDSEAKAWQKAANIIKAAQSDLAKVMAAIKACAAAMPTKGAGSDVVDWSSAAIKLAGMLRQGARDLQELADDPS